MSGSDRAAEPVAGGNVHRLFEYPGAGEPGPVPNNLAPPLLVEPRLGRGVRWKDIVADIERDRLRVERREGRAA